MLLCSKWSIHRFSQVSPTPYTYVKDSKGCTGTVNVITEPTALVATVTEVSFACSPSNTKVAGVALPSMRPLDQEPVLINTVSTVELLVPTMCLR